MVIKEDLRVLDGQDKTVNEKEGTSSVDLVQVVDVVRLGRKPEGGGWKAEVEEEEGTLANFQAQTKWKAELIKLVSKIPRYLEKRAHSCLWARRRRHNSAEDRRI